MATAALIPLSQYLRTSYEPDAEFVEGRIEERPIGELDHSDLQSRLNLLLGHLSNLRFFRCNVELRVQTTPGRYRVFDLCLLAAGSPREQIVLTPPLLCIEILSPEDTMRRTLVRIREFLAMGVPEVWVFDPESRTVQVCIGSSVTEHTVGNLTVPTTPVVVSLAEVFSVLDA